MHQPITEIVYNLYLLINLDNSETGGTFLVDSYTFDPNLVVGDSVKITDWNVGEASDTSIKNSCFSFDAKVMDIQKIISRHQSFTVNIILESPDRELVSQLRALYRARNPEQFSS